LRAKEGDLGLARVPTVRLMELTEGIGVDRHQFTDLFKVTSAPARYPIVYSGKESVRTSMLVTPNAFAEPTDVQAAQRAWGSYSSRLLLPDRLRLNHAHVLALYSQQPTMSNMFYSARLQASELQEVQEKALALWLNTSWGILTFLLDREETEGAWVQMKIGHWRLHKVIDVRAISADALSRLAKAFDQVARKQPRRLPDQFAPGNVDPVRLEIDLLFLKALQPELAEDRARKDLESLYERLHIALSRWFGRALS
ncbi:MAG: hypothetical protein ABDH61_01140, partial [Acidilobaceae archaeon]